MNIRELIIRKLGGVPLPKAGEGQIVVGPVVRKAHSERKEKVQIPPDMGQYINDFEQAHINTEP